MKVTYIGHSGVSIEIDDCVFVIDFYKGNMPSFEKDKKIFFFVSHAHPDHFNEAIYNYQYKYENVGYFLSDDVLKHISIKNKVTAGGQRTIFVHKNKNIYVNVDNLTLAKTKEDERYMSIETLTSTDEGVAFIIEYGGKTIYHGGDLHWWTWKGETKQEYEGMTAAYKAEIEKIRNRHFDAAFTVLDPRQEERYWMGMDYFLRTVDADNVFPIHFWEDFGLIKKFKDGESAGKYKGKVIDIHNEGEVFEI